MVHVLSHLIVTLCYADLCVRVGEAFVVVCRFLTMNDGQYLSAPDGITYFDGEPSYATCAGNEDLSDETLVAAYIAIESEFIAMTAYLDGCCLDSFVT